VVQISALSPVTLTEFFVVFLSLSRRFPRYDLKLGSLLSTYLPIYHLIINLSFDAILLATERVVK
jgi:hypothetical protein